MTNYCSFNYFYRKKKLFKGQNKRVWNFLPKFLIETNKKVRKGGCVSRMVFLWQMVRVLLEQTVS